MYLSGGQVGKKYIIKSIFLEDKLKYRLQVLGLIKNTKIEILNKSFRNSLVLKVRGTKLAVGKKIIDAIKIEEVQNGENDKRGFYW